MWRIWNCIPRFIRQPLHGPRASAGVYVEEEKAEHDVEKFVSESAKEEQDGRAYCIHPFQGSGQGPGESGSKEGAHQGHDSNWKHTYHGDFWAKFCAQYRALEAATWGAAVVLGLQLSRQPHLHGLFEQLKEKDRNQRWHMLLFHVAFSMPPESKLSIDKSISGEQARRKYDAEPKSEQNEKDHGTTPVVSETKTTLDDVMQEFEASCRHYAAVGSSVSAISAADRGQLPEAVQHLWQACQMGHAPAYFNLAVCYDLGLGVRRDEKQAAVYYRMAADVGHAQSIFNLALMTLKGEGGLVKDKTKAIQLLKKAAQQGLAEAQTFLGVYYTENDDDQQDFEQAASFFKAAADQNDTEGLYFLGICYENGWGVNSSDEEAARLYSAAAQLGHDNAMYNLAAFYEYGLGGLSCDEEEAKELYRKAAEQGNESAKFKLQEEEAKQAVSLWKDQQTEKDKTTLGEKSAVRLNSHSSSPELTDNVHEGLAGMWVGDLAAWSTSQTLVTSCQHQVEKSQKSSTTFTIGGHPVVHSPRETEEGNRELEMTFPFLELAGHAGEAHDYMKGLQRTSTMPELRMVPCQ